MLSLLKENIGHTLKESDMTLVQGKKISELESQGWTVVMAAPSMGGPVLMKDSDGNTYTVSADGSVNPNQ
jgi:hypothetical protein